MKHLSKALVAIALLTASASSMAWWGNRGWDNGWNDWPVWTPMYWAEEFFDDNDWYGPYGYYPYYGGYGYPGYGYGGYPNYGGYGYAPYGYGYPNYYRPYGW